MKRVQNFSTNLEVHLLRHFDIVSDEYLTDLSSRGGIQKDELRGYLQFPASKFHPSFASTPLSLYERLSESSPQDWQVVAELAGKIDYVVNFPKMQWPKGIGYDQIIAAKDLTKENLGRIKLQRRGQFMVKTLVCNAFPITNQLVIVLDNKQAALTIFPGQWLPPLDENIVDDYIFLMPTIPDQSYE